LRLERAAAGAVPVCGAGPGVNDKLCAMQYMLHEGPVGCCQNHANIGFDVDIRNSEAQLNAHERVPCEVCRLSNDCRALGASRPTAGAPSARRPQHGHAVAAARRAGRSRSREPSRGVGRGSEPAAASDPPPGRRAHPGRSGSRPHAPAQSRTVPQPDGPLQMRPPPPAARRRGARTRPSTRLLVLASVYFSI